MQKPVLGKIKIAYANALTSSRGRNTLAAETGNTRFVSGVFR
jgi:hypothetical protein